MNAQQFCLQYLKNIENKDFRMSLEPMLDACQRIGRPHLKYPCIHIAGTNGKGSTAAFLESILRNFGLKVGLVTSPHLVTVQERIQLNRENISWDKLWDVIQKIISLTVRPACPPVVGRELVEGLSYFEMMVLAGFEYFAQENIDVAIVETGMGGRLDATNVIKPSVVILTPISFDHQKYLGNTLEKIAEEKCGIIKSGVPVISAPQSDEVRKVIERRCKELKCKLIWADPSIINTSLGLAGDHQKINAACAVTATEFFFENHPIRGELTSTVRLKLVEGHALTSLSRTDRANGGLNHTLTSTHWPARLQYLQRNPDILIDGAHNEAGITTLATFLNQNYPNKKIHFLLGVLEDKNWEKLFLPLLLAAKEITCITPNSPRALSAELLANSLKQHTDAAVSISTQSSFQALHTLKNTLNSSDLLVATGSLYMIGQLCQPPQK